MPYLALPISSCESSLRGPFLVIRASPMPGTVRVNKLSPPACFPQQSSSLGSPQPLKCSYSSAAMRGAAGPSALTAPASQATGEHTAAPKARPRLLLFTFWKGSRFLMSSNRLETPQFLEGFVQAMSWPDLNSCTLLPDQGLLASASRCCFLR